MTKDAADIGSPARAGKSSWLSEPTREKLLLTKKKLKEIWGIFRGNKMGMAGLIILLFFVIMAVFAPLIMDVLAWIFGWEHGWAWNEYVSDDQDGAPPTPEHLLGTDNHGTDILARVLYGTRVSLLVGIVATVVSMGLGAGVGLLSGFWGGVRDEVLMRITDVFLVIPWLALMIVLATLMPGGATVSKVIFVIGITGWSSTARIVRAQVFSVKERAFVERARAIGAGDAYIVRRHIFPNVFPLVFANSILTVALSILSESTLSFIQLGPDSNKVVTWGNILGDADLGLALQQELYLWVIVPGLCIVFLVMGFAFVGYALDEIFNPKLRKR